MKSVVFALVMLACSGYVAADKGDVTRDEYLKRAEAHFDKVDTNHDGVLSETERDAARARMHEKMAKHGKDMPDMMEHHMKGDLSKADYMKRAGEHFDRMDANHDGKLTAAERKAYWQSMRNKASAAQ
ncbi:hypothetical protein [Jeongeupia chitinilytica]|uniref:EF-hand domain-containing protein n=1 Tax=Jeongeupia chitinilytica TaxID=1041641 RepID=A0ABQ3GUR0_9NEIS|nr:hypothetical protein [Jeongeupia chitinilytica]GHD55139.1 hypothetical protein GCM10007350_00380 [Jeongeupia chitinilytica]